MSLLNSALTTLTDLFSANPAMIVAESVMAVAGFTLVFLILYTLKDIWLRTHSFLYQLVAIVLVAGLPFVGFALYLLIRPARTLKERETERILREIWIKMQMQHPQQKKRQHQQVPQVQGFKTHPRFEVKV